MNCDGCWSVTPAGEWLFWGRGFRGYRRLNPRLLSAKPSVWASELEAVVQNLRDLDVRDRYLGAKSVAEINRRPASALARPRLAHQATAQCGSRYHAPKCRIPHRLAKIGLERSGSGRSSRHKWLELKRAVRRMS